MTESKHTPGPFHVTDCRHQKNGQLKIFAERGGQIANVLRTGPNPKANAALFAAAPDMLESMKAARKALEHEAPSGCWVTGPLTGNIVEDYCVCPGCRAIAAIDAAIAKATSTPLKEG